MDRRRQIPPDDERSAATASRVILDAEPIDVPDVPALLRELDDLRGRRG